MFLHVEEARYIRGHKLWVRFNDGASGEVDLSGELTGPVFEPLRDTRAFRRFRVDAELSTVVWDNGADLAPEFLRERLRPGRRLRSAPGQRRKTETRFRNHIVEDVRRARRALFKECGGTLEGLCKHLRAEQAKHPEQVVNLRKRKNGRNILATACKHKIQSGAVSKDPHT